MECNEQLMYMTEYTMKIILLCEHRFMNTPFSKGPDLPPMSKKKKGKKNNNEADDVDHDGKTNEDVEKEKQETDKAFKSLQANQSAIRLIKNTMKSAVKMMKELKNSGVSEGKFNEVKMDLEFINRYEDILTKSPANDELESKPLRGRQAVEFPPAKEMKANDSDISKICSVCKGVFVKLGEIKEELFSKVITDSAIIDRVCNTYPVSVCTQCGKIEIHIAPNQNVPVVPYRSVTAEMCISTMMYQSLGLAINTFVDLCNQCYEFGNDTIYRNYSDFIDIYISPLFEQIINKAKEADVILADGTPFDCLEAQGKRAAKGGVFVDESKIIKQNYVLALTNSAYVPEEDSFVIYDFINSRSTKAISTLFDESFNFSTICTDGYSGYSSLIKNIHPNTQQQVCLIHFRREIIDAIKPNLFVQDWEKLTPDELLQLIINFHIADKIEIKFIYVLIAIAHIFAYEHLVNDSSLESKELRIKQRQNEVADLMNHIDVLMNEISVGKIQANGSKYKATSKTDPYTKACVFYANNKEQMRTFLTNPNVEPSTNRVEQCIRPLTVIRKNINWKGTIHGMNDLCKVLTITETAARLNIPSHKLESHLRDYSHALYKHCLEKRWTEAYREGKSLDKKIIDWNMKKLSEDFDFSKWSLYELAKRLKANK